MTTYPTSTSVPLANVARATPTAAVDAAGNALGQTVATTRAYNYAVGQRLTVTAASSRTSAITATEVMLHASHRMWVRVGNSSVNASNGAGSFPLEAGEKFHLRITSGERVAAIRDAEDGLLTIMPVL